MKEDYSKYKKVYYSQAGEDGVLEAIFKRIGNGIDWFVDVGAWDGKYLSNTYLFLERGWCGLEIETNRKKVAQMMKNFMGNPRAIPILYEVKPEGIDSLLAAYPLSGNFGLLNIDIDCYDYWVWKNLKNYRPKVVCIESNGLNYDYVQPPVVGYAGKKGSSASEIIKLGKEKGYELVLDMGNLIFVREDFYHLL